MSDCYCAVSCKLRPRRLAAAVVRAAAGAVLSSATQAGASLRATTAGKGYAFRMTTRSILIAAAVAAISAAPAAALADLQVTANGFHRVVVDAGQTGSCHVHRMDNDNGTTIRCPDGSKGTMVLYQHSKESSACEVDFWSQSNGANPWRVQLSHQNSTVGTCTTHWDNPTTLEVNLQPPS